MMMYDTMTDFIHPAEDQISLLHQKGSPISPPTPLTPLSNNNNSYSLFDSNDSSNSPWDWFSGSNAALFRKHSVNADGNDFSNISSPTTSTNGNNFIADKTTNFWRRASEPNTINYSSSAVCTSCLNKQSQLMTSSCGQHQFCHSCLNSQSLNLLLQGVCPLCTQTSARNYNMHLATKPNNTTNDYSMLQYYPSTPQATLRNVSLAPTHYACAKLSNIPWDVSQNDVRHFFGNCRSPSLSVCTQSIHIMMDRTTGKTLSDAYVEFASVSDMRRALDTRNQKPLKGRIVSVNECSQEELLSVVFPKWRGQFHGTLAIPPASEIVRTMSTAAGGGNSGCPPFITREEINSILVVCKNYKLHFSRKCAERPFENIITVIAKYPWQQSHLITTMHRDHIYEMLKLSIESLKAHLSKDYVQIDLTLLERLTRAGIMCPAFTERQKTTLLQTARIDCPADIESFLVPPNAVTTTTTPPGFSSLPIQSPITMSPSTEKHQNTLSRINSNKQQSLFSCHQQQSRTDSQQEYVLMTKTTSRESVMRPWEQSIDSNTEDDELELFLLPNNSPISSLIRDIQQHCYFDEKPNDQQSRKLSLKNNDIVNSGIPLLLQPITNLSQSSLEQHYQQKSEERHQQRQNNTNITRPIRQLSPWAPSYAPKTPSADIWRISTSAESNHASSKSLLAA